MSNSKANEFFELVVPCRLLLRKTGDITLIAGVIRKDICSDGDDRLVEGAISLNTVSVVSPAVSWGGKARVTMPSVERVLMSGYFNRPNAELLADKDLGCIARELFKF